MPSQCFTGTHLFASLLILLINTNVTSSEGLNKFFLWCKITKMKKNCLFA